MKPDPRHEITQWNLLQSAHAMDELCRMVNSYAEKLGLGRKVRAEDWSERLYAMAEKAKVSA